MCLNILKITPKISSHKGDKSTRSHLTTYVGMGCWVKEVEKHMTFYTGLYITDSSANDFSSYVDTQCK